VARGFIEPGEKPRRFYREVATAPAGDGFAVRLDGRDLRAPKGTPLVLPTPALADLVAEEWAAQGAHLELGAMHATRLANTAVESLPTAREATADQVAQYAAADLICYFADAPAGLVERQAQRWGPWLARVEAEAGLRFVRAAGIVHQPQPPETIAAVRALALARDDFALAGLAFGTALFGSAILAIGVSRGWLAGPEAFDVSRLDEGWQEETWGVDAEAAERSARLRGEAAMLDRWFAALRPG
jgi:chaperone required for assembly of F1-ATPase